eukprot:CAMPEP_0171907934 /NCGR_PEP_ID=MMETSP0993-20121228/7410_1 /TAXON_ID=483369 /ORGANISM="non described non described, Strain CCMP2098" /LENGTH=425 /DNA_ID=CAMNT_0012540361 /DNA_START=52 /DNA_END=1325 /DNA_ORIENTATION=+
MSETEEPKIATEDAPPVEAAPEPAAEDNGDDSTKRKREEDAASADATTEDGDDSAKRAAVDPVDAAVEETPAEAAAAAPEAAPVSATTSAVAAAMAVAMGGQPAVADPQIAAIQAAAHAAAQASMTAAAHQSMMGSMFGGGMAAAQPAPMTMMPVAGGGGVMIDCPPTLVGRIIGKGGETIRDLQVRSGCQIQIDQNFPEGQPRKISVQGTPQGIELAKQLIHNVLNSGPGGTMAMMGLAPIAGLPGAEGPEQTQIVDCPSTVVGRVIGKGGETIRALQMQSGCRIQIDQNFPEGMPRKISVAGTAAQVAAAVQLINMKINEGGPGGLVPAFGAPGGPNTVLDCPKTIVGRVIGRGGETINDLQARSGAKIQIDQQVSEGSPCKIQISGSPQTVELAIKMVTDIMNGGPLPGQGGMMGGGGKGMG